MSAGETPNPDDPAEYYLEEMRLDNKALKTIHHFENAVQWFEEYISNSDSVSSFEEITPRDVKRIKTYIENNSNKSEKTIKEILERVKRMYSFYSDRGTYEANPVEIALDDINWKITNNPSRRSISITEMKKAVNEISHPQYLLIIVLFLKTGMRVGEMVNLDLRDVHIDHPLSDRLLPEPRGEIIDKPDTLYIPAEIDAGDVYNGEMRTASNKRKRATKIPIDDELKRVLVWWLMARGNNSSTNALIIRTEGRKLGGRHKTNSLRNIVTNWAEDLGWYKTGDGAESNVTPHYFRHFFTTKMRHRLTDSDIDGNDPRLFVKGIRGDKGRDVVETYTHEWGNYVRETYYETMYSVL